MERERNLDQLLPKLAKTVAKERETVASWPLRTDGFAAIEEGFAKTFRDGRKAMRIAEDAPDQSCSMNCVNV
jgi:hypothetical protein